MKLQPNSRPTATVAVSVSADYQAGPVSVVVRDVSRGWGTVRVRVEVRVRG